MPTLNPRLTITLQPTLAAQLRRLADLTGNSQSAIISELLDGSAPVFDKIIRVLEAAHLAKDSLKGSITVEMDAAQEKLQQQLGFALDTLDEGTRSLLDAAESIKRRRRGVSRQGRAAAPAAQGGPASRGVPAVPATGVPTPLSNRGVRSLTNTTKTIASAADPASPKVGKGGVKVRGVGRARV